MIVHTVGVDTNQARPIILGIYEEVVGPVHRIDHIEGLLTATIGAIPVILPPEMEEELLPHVGQKIGIIRCDDPVRPYRTRSLG